MRATTTSCEDLTTPPTHGPKNNQWNITDSEVAGTATPSHIVNGSDQRPERHRAHRWIEADMECLVVKGQEGVSSIVVARRGCCSV